MMLLSCNRIWINFSGETKHCPSTSKSVFSFSNNTWITCCITFSSLSWPPAATVPGAGKPGVPDSGSIPLAWEVQTTVLEPWCWGQTLLYIIIIIWHMLLRNAENGICHTGSKKKNIRLKRQLLFATFQNWKSWHPKNSKCPWPELGSGDSEPVQCSPHLEPACPWMHQACSCHTAETLARHSLWTLYHNYRSPTRSHWLPSPSSLRNPLDFQALWWDRAHPPTGESEQSNKLTNKIKQTNKQTNKQTVFQRVSTWFCSSCRWSENFNIAILRTNELEGPRLLFRSHAGSSRKETQSLSRLQSSATICNNQVGSQSVEVCWGYSPMVRRSAPGKSSVQEQALHSVAGLKWHHFHGRRVGSIHYLSPGPRDGFSSTDSWKWWIFHWAK